MISNTSTMDKPVARARVRGLRWLWGTIALSLVLVTGGLAIAPLRSFFRAERSVERGRLRIAEVSVGDLERDISAQGRLVAAQHPTLFSRAEGILSLSVKAGLEVKRGQLLARIESPALKSRLLQERTTLESLQAELRRQQLRLRQAPARSRQLLAVLEARLAAAERGAARGEQLRAEGLLNAAEHDKLKLDLDLARLELDNAKQNAQFEWEGVEFEVGQRSLLVERQANVVRELEQQVEELTIHAPFDGLIANVVAQDKDVVRPVQPLLTVVNLSALEVEFEAPENQAADLAPGTRAEIFYENQRYPGRVTAVSPEIRDSQLKGTLVFEGEAPAGLRQSQRVTTRFVLERKERVKRLPRGPFVEGGGGRQVYVVREDEVFLTPIQMGALSVSDVEILSGLEVGDKVVISDPGVFEGARRAQIRN